MCKDSNDVRDDETLGIIVMEAGSATSGGISFLAARGSNSVNGYTEGSFSYGYSGFSAAPAAAIVSQVGMNGGDGSWAVLRGPPGTSSMLVAVDEDDIGGASRNHPADETLDYIVLSAVGPVELTAAPP